MTTASIFRVFYVVSVFGISSTSALAQEANPGSMDQKAFTTYIDGRVDPKRIPLSSRLHQFFFNLSLDAVAKMGLPGADSEILSSALNTERTFNLQLIKDNEKSILEMCKNRQRMDAVTLAYGVQTLDNIIEQKRADRYQIMLSKLSDTGRSALISKADEVARNMQEVKVDLLQVASAHPQALAERFGQRCAIANSRNGQVVIPEKHPDATTPVSVGIESGYGF